MRKITAALAVLSLAVLVAACGDSGGGSTATPSADATFPLTVTSCGKPVSIPKRPAKALAVGAAATNLLVAAGAGDRIVSLAGDEIPPSGSFPGVDAPILTRKDPSTEAIIGSGADIVFSYGLFEAKPENLKQAGIASLVESGDCDHGADPNAKGANNDYPTIFRDIETYGRLFGTDDKAAASIAELKQRVAAIKARIKPGPTMTAAGLYFEGKTLSSNAGRPSMLHVNMQIVGLRNVLADVHKLFFDVSVEDLINRDPEVVILTYGYRGDDTFAQVKKQLLAVPGIRDLRAVKNNRIVGYKASESRSDPLAVDGIEALAEALGRY